MNADLLDKIARFAFQVFVFLLGSLTVLFITSNHDLAFGFAFGFFTFGYFVGRVVSN